MIAENLEFMMMHPTNESHSFISHEKNDIQRTSKASATGLLENVSLHSSGMHSKFNIDPCIYESSILRHQMFPPLVLQK
jgi:hypothetical protein